MRTRAMAVVLLGTLLAGACTIDGGGGSSQSSATTTTEEGTTTTTDGGSPEPVTEEGCGEPPVWVLKRMPEPPTDDDGQAEDCEEPEPGPELGTGDVQITLRWTSDADLDLHVTEPDGTEIWFGDQGPTATGGRLDVDSNIGCEEDGSVENVFWAEGDMPLGEYEIEIVGYTVDGCGGGDYNVIAKVEGEEILNENGSVDEDEADPYSFEVE